MIGTKLVFGCCLLHLYLNVGVLSLNLFTKTRFENVVLLRQFWKSTGLSPATEQNLRTSFLLSDDEKLNLDFIGALPNQAIKMIRIHWILDLVTVSNADSEKPSFHLENLDRLIDRIYRNGLYPSFELMGNPSNFFHDFKKQSGHWTFLIEQIINHYSNLYGAGYVSEWKFELTNEPDLKQYNSFNFTLAEYLDYFRASEKAVTSLVGPAGLFRDNRVAHPLCWGFLDFCSLNQCNLDMITFHRKGDEVGSQVVVESLDLINTLISKYPNLKGVPFGNDEADIMKGWYKPLEWRADVRYAALVVQVIIGHIYEMFIRRNIPFNLLSNDNAFLSFSPNYFTQRTLLARTLRDSLKFATQSKGKLKMTCRKCRCWGNFILGTNEAVQKIERKAPAVGKCQCFQNLKYINETFIPVVCKSARHLSFPPPFRFQMNDTEPAHVQFFRKPVYSVMGMLSLLGDYLKDIRYNPGVKGFSYLVTSYKYQDTFLGVITDDRVTNETYIVTNETYVDVNVKIALGNLTLSGICVGYVMDNDGSSPYQVWRDGGKPDFPGADLRRKMREAEGFRQLFIRKVKPHQTQLKFALRNVLVPSIFTVNICYEGTDEPGEVTDLRYENVTRNEILLFWTDTSVDSRCILTYVVEFREVGATYFRRINKLDTIFLFYHHEAVNGSVAGEYRVAAVDYWNRYGAFSLVLTVA